MGSAWETLFLMHSYEIFLSLFLSVKFCRAEGVPLEEYINILDKQGQSYEKRLCKNIRSGNYQETSAPLELGTGGIQ